MRFALDCISGDDAQDVELGRPKARSIAMELHPVTFSKALLDSIPEDERTFHVMAGQLANDLNILTKLMHMAMNPVAGHEVLTRANTTVAMLVIKLLAGRLNEGWELISRQFSPLYKRYESDLSDDAKQRLTKLKKYFGHKNLINTIRKQLAFHQDDKAVKRGYDALTNEEIFVDYYSPFRGHCLYYSSEIIAFLAMTKLVNPADPDDWKAAIGQIVDETIRISTWIGDFILEFMRVFMVRYVAKSIDTIEGITIDDGPPLDAVIIPFFCAPA
jgi:hypothetical protein